MIPETLSSWIRQYTLDHGGATVITVPRCPSVPLTGYIVGVAGCVLDPRAVANEAVWHNAMLQFTTQFHELLDEIPISGIGTWFDPERQCHMDVILWTETPAQAEAVAQRYVQRAYYDVAKAEEVYLHG